MKRIFDLICSITFIITLLPLLILVSFIVKFTSNGPVIFKQRRIGKRKMEFYIYKFRTMYIDCPEDTPTHLLDNPKRYITPIGKVLRKTSLDELPQLFNILKGEMSFVGPRPALYNQDDLIALREQYGINNIRPGLTGWAQINGRDELKVEEKVQFDKYYAEKFSIGLDIKIIFLTFIKVLSGSGVVEGTATVENKEKMSVGN